ncbi:MAG: glycosyltransferase, partial [Candidatus Nomurabacteria bacterium]|nr:glycosyltransferase [Candidatus Nomurabacteria bacterium]
MKKKFFGVVVAILASASIITYLVWRIGFTLPNNVNTVSLVFAIILIVFEVACAIELFIYYRHVISIQEPKKPKVNKKDFPEVDVLVPTLDESIEILQEMAEACTKMEYPDHKKVHIFLLDDSNRKDVAKLAKKLKIGYIARRDHVNAKAGNLNHALTKTKSPLVAIFDADMIPSEKFLMETVPYFMSKEKIGFIQTPQMFYEPDMFQFNLYAENTMPNEHEYFYRVVQPSKNKSNSVIFCGTNAVISRDSLDEVGGFSTRSITEDFATGVEIQSKGYKCLAISTPLAWGLPPHNLQNLFSQRVRWARGNIQSGRRENVVFRRGLSLWQRINYFSAVMSWFFPVKQLIFLAAPVLFAVFGIVFVKCTLTDVLIFWLPMYVLSNFSIWYFSKKMRKTKWTRLYETIFAPALFLPVLMEMFGMTYDNFAVTDKKRRSAENKDSAMYKVGYALPFFIALVLTGFGIYNIIISINDGSVNHYVVLFWLLLNVYY